MPTFAQAVASAQAKAPLMRATSMEEAAEDVEMTSFSSGLVDAGETFQLDRKAFEISYALSNEALSETQTFNFCRSARKSILLSLGVSAHAAGNTEQAQVDILTPYAKASNQACMNAYMAVVLGPGTFRLSRAISRCGWLIRFGALLCLSLMHIFICLRLVEVPQLIRQDVPNATFLAKLFLTRRAYWVVAVLSVASWFGASAIQLSNVISNILTVVAFDVAEYADVHKFRNTAPFGWKLFAVMMLAVTIVPLSLKSSAKDLQTKASYAVYAMLAIGAVEMCCAFIHGTFQLLGPNPIDYDMVGSNIIDGLFDMALAFGGIAILPYVLADMLEPQNARKVVTKATTRIMFFYLAVAMVGYFGWANSIQIMTPLQMMMSMSFGYQSCARIISLLFIIKTLTTFPLTFWPLYREVESLLQLDEVLGVQLHLPWAVRRQMVLKVATKICLVTMCLLTLLLNGQSSHRMVLLFMGIPLNVCHFAFPACVGCLAIRRHWQLLKTGQEAREDTVEYMFHSKKIHYWSVHVMAAVMIAICLGLSSYMVLNLQSAPDPQDGCSLWDKSCDIDPGDRVP